MSTEAEKLGFPLKTTADRCRQIRKALIQAGYWFIVPIQKLSIEDLLAEDNKRKQDGKPRQLGFVNGFTKTFASSKMKIAINPDKFKIAGSNYLSTDEQKKMIAEELTKLRRHIPRNLRDFAKARMLGPSEIAQIALYPGGLITNYYVRADGQYLPGFGAVVGRYDPERLLHVYGRQHKDGYPDVFAAFGLALPEISCYKQKNYSL